MLSDMPKNLWFLEHEDFIHLNTEGIQCLEDLMVFEDAQLRNEDAPIKICQMRHGFRKTHLCELHKCVMVLEAEILEIPINFQFPKHVIPKELQ